MFVEKYFYPQEIEDSFQQIETKAFKKLNQMRNEKNTFKLMRKDFDMIKEYVLLQIYRTPYSLTNFKTNSLNDTLHIIKKDIGCETKEKLTSDEIKSYSLQLIRTILDEKWSEKLCHSKFSKLASDFKIIDSLHPLIIKSYEENFILSDSGYANDLSYCYPPRYVNGAPLEEVFNRPFSNEEKQHFEKSPGSWLNFIHFPISFDTSLLLISDFWRAEFYTGSWEFLDCFGIKSDFLRKYNNPPIYIFDNAENTNNHFMRPIEDVMTHFSSNDEIIVFVEEISKKDVSFLNQLTIDYSESEIIFKDVEKIPVTIDESAKRYEKKLSTKDGSIIYKADFNIPYEVSDLISPHGNRNI